MKDSVKNNLNVCVFQLFCQIARKIQTVTSLIFISIILYYYHYYYYYYYLLTEKHSWSLQDHVAHRQHV